MSKQQTIRTAGKRKSAIARAVLKPGKGLVRVNGQLLDAFQPDLARAKIMEPLVLAGDVADKVHIDVSVMGGGVMSQVDAARLAIGRALAQFGGEKTRKTLLDYDRALLVADIRRKETRKR